LAAPSASPPPKSVIEVEMPDQEPEASLGVIVPYKATPRPRKRVRPAEVSTESDTDAPSSQGFTIVRSRRGRPGQQDIRDSLALLPPPSSYE
jgi:hypothetical protein